MQIIKEIYKHRECGIDTDVYKFFSSAAEKLLRFKVKLCEYERERVNYGWYDYTIDVKPYDVDKWNDKEIQFVVKRKWRYFLDSDIVTGRSEPVKLKIENSNSGKIITEFYDIYSDLSLGDIDESYERELKNKNDIDVFLENFFNDYKKIIDNRVKQREEDKKQYQEYIERKRSKSTGSILEEDDEDLLEEDVSESMFRSKVSLDRTAIKKWVRSNFNKHIPKAPDKAKYNYYNFLTRSSLGSSNKGPYAKKKKLTYENAKIGDIVQVPQWNSLASFYCSNKGKEWKHICIVTDGTWIF